MFHQFKMKVYCANIKHILDIQSQFPRTVFNDKHIASVLTQYNQP